MIGYKTLLKEEFEKSTGLKSDDAFKYWLQYKKNHLARQFEFLKNIGLDITHSTIELNKGKYDTLGIVIPSTERLIEVSRYGVSIQNDKVFKCLGDLVIIDKKEKIAIDDNVYSCIDLSENINYIVDLPIYHEIKTDLVELASINKNVFINIYGSVNDINLQEKLQKLYQLKHRIESQCDTTCLTNYATVFDTFLCTISTKRDLMKEYIKTKN